MGRKKMPWFRVYAEMVTDRKIRRLKVEHRWLWIAVLAAASESPKRGYLLLTTDEPVEITDLADLSALPSKTCQAGMRALSAAGLVDRDEIEGCWFVPKWDQRQFASDQSAERVRAHRERSGNGGSNDDGTLQTRSRNGRGNAPETETESETESSSSARPLRAVDNPAQDDDDDRAAAACRIIGDRMHQRALDAGDVKTNPAGHKKSCRTNATLDWGDEATYTADTHPEWTPQQVADHLVPPLGIEPDPRGHFLPGTGWVS